MSPPDIQAALYPVADLLDELGVRWHVCGSVASSAHGAARATLDVDIVADLQEEHVARFLHGLLAARRLRAEEHGDEHGISQSATGAVGRRAAL